LLLERGGDILAKDVDGRTAIDLARNDKIREMLEDPRNKNSLLYKIKKCLEMGD
jgi:hypothetical protein